MAAISRSSLTLLVAPVGALVAWLGVAAALLAIPQAGFDNLVYESGLGTLLDTAAAPLNPTARAVIAVNSGAIAALITWSALFLLFGPGGFLNKVLVGGEGVPAVRHADAHPDAPPRRPLSAHADLGAPMPTPDPGPPPIVRPIPVDLDQPIAAFHPAAIPEVPREPLRPVAPLVPQPLEAGEWIETIDLTPSMPDEDATGQGRPSIEALLQRLENARPRRLQTR
ncbi:MAG TPA: hypothetical protein VM900_13975 [Sphingomonas sp.]|jgi:hypothetical protein|nr:hypothetical protein [Sphingomonas sp.]